MKEERKNRYFQKIQHLEKYLDYLNDWIQINSIEEVVQKSNKINSKDLFAIYHAFQLAMEVISDLASMISKDLSELVRDDYYNLEILFQKKILSSSLFRELKDLNGLRNRIVHDYNGIIDPIALKGIIVSREILPIFKECVKKWIKIQ